MEENAQSGSAPLRPAQDEVPTSEIRVSSKSGAASLRRTQTYTRSPRENRGSKDEINGEIGAIHILTAALPLSGCMLARA
jgi:hypothetical protein